MVVVLQIGHQEAKNIQIGHQILQLYIRQNIRKQRIYRQDTRYCSCILDGTSGSKEYTDRKLYIAVVYQLEHQELNDKKIGHHISQLRLYLYNIYNFINLQIFRFFPSSSFDFFYGPIPYSISTSRSCIVQHLLNYNYISCLICVICAGKKWPINSNGFCKFKQKLLLKFNCI